MQQSTTTTTTTDPLLAPFRYLTQNPGKEIRSQLLAAFNAWLHVPAATLEKIAQITEMLHTSSLLIDDVQDASELRRGVPVAHKIFGIPTTINCANYVYFIALERVLDLGNQEATRVFTHEMLQLHRGQGMELYWRDSHTCPRESEYIDMVLNSE
jgi:geranylgeranyl diphosphate synthase type 3